MRSVIIGLGKQGIRRQQATGLDVVATVDPHVESADHRHIEDVPLEAYEAACVCTSNEVKLPLMRYLLEHGKHVLVEKPLLATASAPLEELQALARRHQAACYTAYNHRFEPQIVRLKQHLSAGAIGKVLTARFYYGKGTARSLRGTWRDVGAGVLTDLGSHLLDLALFLFGPGRRKFNVWDGRACENRAWDQCTFASVDGPSLQFEVSLLSWKNTFTIDVIGDQGSLHLNGLCKWGPSRLALRRRVLPSGVPVEHVHTMERADPTWRLEHEHFKRLCQTGESNLGNDLWIQETLQQLARSVERKAA